MKLKLKEDPRVWRQFTLVWGVFLGGVLWLVWREHPSLRGGLRVASGLCIVAVVACLVWPRLIRPVYRVVMTGSFHMGQVMGRVMLAALFLGILTPLGLLLRASGKDLLKLRRDPGARTYWQPAKSSDEFDRQI